MRIGLLIFIPDFDQVFFSNKHIPLNCCYIWRVTWRYIPTNQMSNKPSIIISTLSNDITLNLNSILQYKRLVGSTSKLY